jgi:signal transduction histidine kinase
MVSNFLVVEDSKLDREICELLLNESQPSRPDIHFAADCAEAIAQVKQYAPLDCVLLDYNLPDGKGIDIIKEIHSISPSTPVIMMTGESDIRTAKKCLQYGADDYLIKGEFSASMLNRSIEYAIGRRQSRVEEDTLFTALGAEKQLNNTQKDVISLMAHEFSMPLDNINNAVETLKSQMQNLNPACQQACAKIETAAKRLTGLMDNILPMYKTADTDGEFLAKIDSFDLLTLTQEIANDFNDKATHRKIQLHCTEASLMTYGNEKLCRHSIQNLIENAIKHSHAGSAINIHIDADGKYWNISITDQDQYIDDRIIANISAQLTENKTATSDSDGNFALLLAYKFAHYCGGELSVVPSGTKNGVDGTTVTMKWPAYQTQSTQSNVIPLNGSYGT